MRSINQLPGAKPLPTTGRARLITAGRIHDGEGWLPEGTAVEVAANGTIVAVRPHGEGAEVIEGILAPGFVNAHCHLELSHMQGMIPQGTTLIPFLQQVTGHRNDFTDEQKKAARHEAYNTLMANGVVAVGDIANTDDTLDLRLRDGLHIHTFVECLGFTQTHAQARYDYAAAVLARFAAQEGGEKRLSQSLTPHAPYSVSDTLFRLIDAGAPDSLLSIHNQETAAEDEYYQDKTGAVTSLLQGFGIDASFFSPSGTSSLQTYLPWLSPAHPLILVHNTFSGEGDIYLANARPLPPYWCLCPNANLYIEGRLPDVGLLAAHTPNICIGTDSLASNYELSVFSELMILKLYFPQLSWEELIRWGTANGARALQLDEVVGTIQPGKRPGLVQITGIGAG